MSYSVGELSRLAGVSIRTLHHYDEIGLLVPSERTAAGYRQYDDADAERLHRILLYRELGFDLGRIAVILDDAAADPLSQLEQQRTLLRDQLERLQRMLAGVEAMMSAKKGSRRMSAEEMRELFGGFDPQQYEAEAEQRWGETDAYRESQRRAASYGKEHWQQIKAESEGIEQAFAVLLRRGDAADSEGAMDLAEQHRQHIARWFYPCGYGMHRGLAEMYAADPRFAAHYEEREPGLSAYVRAAIIANVERSE